MEAIEYINQNLTQDNINMLLNQLGFSGVHSYGNDTRANCLVHGGNNSTSFIFRTDIKMWYCHACGTYGDIVQLVIDLQKVSLKEACSYIASSIGVSIDGLEIILKPNPLKKDIDKWFKYKEKSAKKAEIELYETPSILTKRVTSFRNFKKETIDKFNLFYVEQFPIKSKKGEEVIIKNRLLTPIWFNGKQVGIMLRKIDKEEKVKWIIQPTSLDKDNILYNLEVGKFYDEIVLVEGIWDVWAFIEADVECVVCLFGVSITEGQMLLLQKHTCNITFAFDGDEAGCLGVIKGIDKTRKIFNVNVVDFELNQDPESITRQELRILYEEKLHYADWLKKHEKEYEKWKSKSKR